MTGTALSTRSLLALNGVNLFAAATNSGFGFVALYLGSEGWSSRDIGFVLSVTAIAALLSQIPAGELLDISPAKRLFAGAGLFALFIAALVIAWHPAFSFVVAALVLQGTTAGLLNPAIVAISLGIVGHAALAGRLGLNQFFQSTGNLIATAFMGAIGYFTSDGAIFFTTAALAVPGIISLMAIRAGDIHFGRSIGAPHHYETRKQPARVKRLAFWTNRPLLIFAGCIFLFQAANASMLPLVGGSLFRSAGDNSSLIMSALIIIPQIVVALLSTWTGCRAESWGRKPLLLIGIGALPLRALLFTFISEPSFLVPIQVLDGVSAVVIGILTALIIADITQGTGRFNFLQGVMGTVASLAAATSTTATGLLDEHFGRTPAFMVVALVALAATALAYFMPETKPGEKTDALRVNSDRTDATLGASS